MSLSVIVVNCIPQFMAWSSGVSEIDELKSTMSKEMNVCLCLFEMDSNYDIVSAELRHRFTLVQGRI